MVGRRRIGVATVALIAVLLTAGSAAAAGDPPAQHNPAGKFLGVVPSHATAKAQPRSAQAGIPLLYHNGVVQHSSRVYSIFWAPPGHGLSFPSGYGGVVNRYFSDVAHDSGSTTNVYASDTQYYDVVNGQQRFISYNVTNGGPILDTHAIPTSSRSCPNYRLADNTTSLACVTDAQQINEINRVITARGLPRGIGVEYFLYMPQRLGSCFDASGLAHGCYDRDYCAYHSWFGSGSNTSLYSSMPYADTPGCDAQPTPRGLAAESVLNVTSHEHNETITDPTGGGWYDNAGYENADKCSFDFGPTIFNGTGYYNQLINRHQYLLQQEWSNSVSDCVQ